MALNNKDVFYVNALSEKFKSPSLKFESYNFGVSGYNTTQESFLLKDIALQALNEIINTCKCENIPCYVVCFPVMHELNDRYPFKFVHSVVEKEVETAGGIFIDIFPLLKGRDAARLRVHPTDQHPNDIVHKIAAEAIAGRIMRDKRI